jgi:hypothetical protein
VDKLRDAETGRAMLVRVPEAGQESELARVVRSRGGLITLAEASAEGFARAAVRWAEQRGRLVRVRRGVFTIPELWEDRSGRERHLLALRAAQRLNPAALAGGPSAALVLDLPLPRIEAAIHVNMPGRPGRRGAGTVRRPRPGGVWVRQGIRMVSPEQAVLECARTFEPGWGLAVADAALAKGYITTESLNAEVAGQPPCPGRRNAAWVARHTRPGAESPLESLARADILLAGLPQPALQVWVSTRRQRYRVDLLDERHRVATEADGKVKYVTPEDLWWEKRREDDLRDAQVEVVRYTMADHHHLGPWLDRYRRALARSRRRLGSAG